MEVAVRGNLTMDHMMDYPRGQRRVIVGDTIFEVNPNYTKLWKIGQGSYGTVCGSLDTKTNQNVAIKKISNVFRNSYMALSSLMELLVSKYVHHPNIVTLKDVMVGSPTKDFKDLYLVYELMDTDLHQVIFRSPRNVLTNDQCQYLLFQMLRGLKHLHDSNIVHQDLKPSNMLVNYSSGLLKICDFSLARSFKCTSFFKSSYIGSRPYRAPEILILCDYFGTPMDMWAIGCIFAEMLSGRQMFPATNDCDQLKMIVDILGTPTDEEADLDFIEDIKTLKDVKQILPKSIGVPFERMFPEADPLAIHLLKQILVFDPKKRISVTGALEHPYLARLNNRFEEDVLPSQIPFNLEGIDRNTEVQKIRNIMWEQMLHCHPEVALFGSVC